MQVTTRSRRLLRWQNLAFVVLLLLITGALAWLSTRYVYQADWTASGRNTLSPASIELLGKLSGAVAITSYARETPLLRKHISELVGRYQRYKHDLTLKFVNPDVEPQKVRELNITTDGELVIEYGGRTEQLSDMTENGLTNMLQQLARGGERRLAFLTGHGERSSTGGQNFDVSGWARQLETKGIKVSEINLATTPEIPADVTVLVIAAPQVDLLPGEAGHIRDYLKRGGNLLWLADPDPDQKPGAHGLEPLAQDLGVQFERGIVVDPNVSQVGQMLFGTSDPRVALVASYPPHDITRNFELNTLFPLAGGLRAEAAGGWQATPILQTLSNTWLETGKVSGQISYDEGTDQPGPVDIGLALSRPRPAPAGQAPAAADQKAGAALQRVVVVADGDFVSNSFLGLGGNLQLALNIVNWLSSDDALIDIPARTAPDLSLQLSRTEIMIIGGGFLLLVPVLLLGSGLFIWFRRRRR
jgi:ABC-type uncharacterized transport system involved in gliding motility auxiliary subunit